MVARNLRSLLVLAIVFATASGCREENAPCDPIGDGARAVSAPRGEPTARLIADWRPPPGSLPELALPTALAASADGRLAIADFQLREVIVVDPEIESSLALRPGRGPGEVDVPLAMAWTSAGDLLVFDAGNSRITRRRPDGSTTERPVDPAFSSAIVASGEVLWTAIDTLGRVYSLQRAPRGDARATEVIVVTGADGEPPDTVASTTVATLEPPYDRWPVPGARRIVPAVGPAGEMVIGGLHPDHRVVVRRGSEVVEVCVPAREATDRRTAPAGPEMDEALAAAIAAAPRIESPAPYGRIIVGTDGRIWAQRDLPAPSDWRDGLYGPPGGIYNVFSSDGTHEITVAAPAGARILAATADHAWGLEFDEMDVPVPVRYAVDGS